MSTFDDAVVVLAKRGVSPERICEMLAQTMGRLIVSSCRTSGASLDRAHKAMAAMKTEMERCSG